MTDTALNASAAIHIQQIQYVTVKTPFSTTTWQVVISYKATIVKLIYIIHFVPNNMVSFRRFEKRSPIQSTDLNKHIPYIAFIPAELFGPNFPRIEKAHLLHLTLSICPTAYSPYLVAYIHSITQTYRI